MINEMSIRVGEKRKNEIVDDILSLKKIAVHTSSIDTQAINSVRCLAAELPQAAKSGHPGAPIGCAPMAHALWGYAMNYSPKEPKWINRDRFVLSNGHACALQYVYLYLCGYDVSLNDLKNFRKFHSRTPGHPESFATPGVEVCTGPLGQGISNAVGMAIAAHHLAEKFNRENFNIIDNYIFVICGDGCLQEGVSSEACSLAGHLGLGRLIVLYDDNNITIDGTTEMSFTEDVSKRFEAYNWHVQYVSDGDHSHQQILQAINIAKEVRDQPSLIIIKTTIAFGSLKEGSEVTHGAPLGVEDVSQLKKKFGFDPEKSFYVPEDVLHFYRSRGEAGDKKYVEWNVLLSEYEKTYKDDYEELNRRIKSSYNIENILKKLPQYTPQSKAEATRSYSGYTLNALFKIFPEIMGGSADLTKSNNCELKGEADFQKNKYIYRYIRYGVREHGMCAITNGLGAYGCILPFCATFLNFITYAWGAIRLSALGQIGTLVIATHDSIELGEDGPTHQPIETLALVRATPNIFAVRPADGNETNGGYLIWLCNRTTPTILALCRSPVPNLENTCAMKTFTYGAYILHDFINKNNDKKKILIGSSGSEVHICINARELLIKEEYDVKIVSMPCWEIFAKQTDEYKQTILNIKERKCNKICTVYVEALSTYGWDKYFDNHIGMKTFGASAPRSECWNNFGFTKENICKLVKEFASM